jgi:BASS family bile acid:Na+ symporter
MPLIAYTLTVVFHLNTALAVGIILVGCCPGGVSSNLMSYLCKGDVAFSVGMTTVSTLLAPVVTPALVLLLAGARVDVDAVGMFLNILIVTILPVGLGFLCNVTLGHNETFCQLRRVMPAFSVLGLACIVGGVVAVIHDDLIRGGLLMFLWTFVVVFCHNGLGYLFGYLAGRLFHFSKAKNRTISIEVGMQNAGLATNLATRFFLATCPLAIVPCAISCAWHSISGTLIATYFARTDKRTTRLSSR